MLCTNKYASPLVHFVDFLSRGLFQGDLTPAVYSDLARIIPGL